MTTLFEGTLDEVRQHLSDLTLPAEIRLQVNVTEESEAVREERNSYADLEQKYANWPRKNGILQFASEQPLTIDQIKELSEDNYDADSAP